MAWTKGTKLTPEHRERIRRGVLATVQMRRRRRTRAQRRIAADLDPASLGARRLTPRKPEPRVFGKPPTKRTPAVKLPPGVRLIGDGPVIERRSLAERDSSGRPISFV